MGRVILVDDDELIGELVSDAFFSAGHACGWLQDGRTALDLIRRRPPDLVILDCNMPEMPGVAILRELRVSPELFKLPVLMLTGRQGTNDEEIMRYHGANDYLRKPVDPIMLVGRAEALMRGEHRWD